MGAACVDVSVWTLNSTSLPNVRIVRGVRRGAKRRGAAWRGAAGGGLTK